MLLVTAESLYEGEPTELAFLQPKESKACNVCKLKSLVHKHCMYCFFPLADEMHLFGLKSSLSHEFQMLQKV